MLPTSVGGPDCECIICTHQRAYQLGDYQQARKWVRREMLSFLREYPDCDGWKLIFFARTLAGEEHLRPIPLPFAPSMIIGHPPTQAGQQAALRTTAEKIGACGMLLVLGASQVERVYLDHWGGPLETWRRSISGCSMLEFDGAGGKLPMGWDILPHWSYN